MPVDGHPIRWIGDVGRRSCREGLPVGGGNGRLSDCRVDGIQRPQIRRAADALRGRGVEIGPCSDADLVRSAEYLDGFFQAIHEADGTALAKAKGTTPCWKTPATNGGRSPMASKRDSPGWPT